MKYFVLAGTLAAACLFGCSHSQAADDGNGPSPELRAQMQQMRGAATTASLNALSSDHRTKVSDIVSQFDSGSLQLDDATSQIDGVLTTAEAQAVLTEQKKMRDAMRQAVASAGSNGFGGRGGGGGGGRRPPDAGRFLLSVMAAPDKYREAVRRPSE